MIDIRSHLKLHVAAVTGTLVSGFHKVQLASILEIDDSLMVAQNKRGNGYRGRLILFTKHTVKLSQMSQLAEPNVVLIPPWG
jgi:hypothetical protein